MYLPNEDKISVNVPTLDLNSLLVANYILSRYEYIINASTTVDFHAVVLLIHILEYILATQVLYFILKGGC